MNPADIISGIFPHDWLPFQVLDYSYRIKVRISTIHVHIRARRANRTIFLLDSFVDLLCFFTEEWEDDWVGYDSAYCVSIGVPTSIRPPIHNSSTIFSFCKKIFHKLAISTIGKPVVDKADNILCLLAYEGGENLIVYVFCLIKLVWSLDLFDFIKVVDEQLDGTWARIEEWSPCCFNLILNCIQHGDAFVVGDAFRSARVSEDQVQSGWR